ncbi:PP2C family protein-serine/threonine phosphatase [Streptomyces sp. NPDC004044]
MLPTLPEHLPGLDVAARYRPSRDGLDIGGDWYDAFVMPDGAIALEIGDAQGHDVDAAAAMGQGAPPCARSPPTNRIPQPC